MGGIVTGEVGTTVGVLVIVPVPCPGVTSGGSVTGSVGRPDALP